MDPPFEIAAGWDRLQTIDAHTAGEPLRVVTGGWPEIPGATILAKRQFAREKSCTACHRTDASTFRIEPFDHAREAKYPLTGAHAQVTCNACHRRDKAGVRRYRGTAQACASCHTDPHRGQFRRNGATNCERCHGSAVAWNDMTFDHNRQTRFPLDRTHAQVACDRCHFGVKQPDGARVVQYRPLGTQCRDCHDFDKR